MVLPSNVMAENAVLGAMLVDPLALQDSVAGLRASDFLLDSHRVIFRRVREMANAGQDVDFLTVADMLKVRGELDAIGGFPYLADLGAGMPRNPSITGYIRLLKERSLARRGIEVFQAAIQRLMAQGDPAAQVIDEVSQQLVNERPDESRGISEMLPLAIDALEPGNQTRIPTGIPEVDQITKGGGRTKELWIVGAQPSAGKSALCRQFERSAIQHGYGVHAHSIEVDGISWVQFHMAHLAGVEPWKLRDAETLWPSDKDRLIGAAAKMDGWKYRIDDAGSVHIDSLLAKSRRSAMRHGVKVVTVDYLQMLSGDEKNLKEQLGKAAKRLKQFAKDNDCWVIALSQLSRQGDINAKPTVQHLKESGDLEAAADVVILNHRPKDGTTAE